MSWTDLVAQRSTLSSSLYAALARVGADAPAGKAPAPPPNAAGSGWGTGNDAVQLSANLRAFVDGLGGAGTGTSTSAGVAAGAQATGDAPSAGLGGALASIGRDLSRVLTAFGGSADTVSSAVQGLSDLAGRQIGGAGSGGSAGIAASAQAASLSLSVEHIHITIGDGQRSLSINFDSASFALQASQESVAATSGSDGSAVTASGSALAVSGQAVGLSIEDNGFRPDEVKTLLGRLGDLLGGKDASGSQGQAPGPSAAPPSGAATGLPLAGQGFGGVRGSAHHGHHHHHHGGGGGGLEGFGVVRAAGAADGGEPADGGDGSDDDGPDGGDSAGDGSLTVSLSLSATFATASEQTAAVTVGGRANTTGAPGTGGTDLWA